PTDDKVEACYGDACPLGECDNSGFLADAQCTDLYPAGVSSSTVYCAAGETGGYCLLTSSKDLSYWAVNCVGGTPQIIYCPNSCGVMNSGASGC
ncbi:MAG TPA: hypothetical protein VGJ91_04155, partial [Polyangiaceae bacterium]